MNENDKSEMIKVLYQCTICGNTYEKREEAEACWNKDTLGTPTFLEERIEELGEMFPREILLKRLEGQKIVEIGTYVLKRIDEVDLSIE